MITVDTQGKLCPQPIILTKKALKTAPQGESFRVLTDNLVAYQNLQDFLRASVGDFQATWDGKLGEITFVNQSAGVAQEVAVDDFCKPLPSTPSGSHVVVLKSTLMGDGEEALGHLLLRAFINSLQEQDVLPKTIILYNEGVKLAQFGSDTLESLQLLEQKGVEIVLCGTCLDYYDLKQQVGVGKVSNMYVIASLLTSASHVIYP